MIKPSDFIDQAYRLVDIKNNPTEVDCRTSVSRAYYSLFHEASEFLEKKGRYKKSNHEPHKEIKNILLGIDTRIGIEFNGYKKRRASADYCIQTSTFTQPNSLSEVIAIDSFIRTIKSLKV